MTLEDIQERKTNVWSIHVEVVQEYKGIVGFKVSKHHMWIQALRDPKKKWLEIH